ncbi:MAG: methyltransferase domain-containing protein [Planctomycetota bacterium]
MTSRRGVFVNCLPANCSIYESGVMCARALGGSAHYSLDYVEVDRFEAIPTGYDLYVFNYHHVTMAWLDPRRVADLDGQKIAFVLEMEQHDPFVLCPDVFDGYCVPDPTLTCDDPRVHAFGRPLEVAADLPPYRDQGVPVIGSFGFATPGKGFEHIVHAVSREFDQAVVRLNIPPATHADPSGDIARQYAGLCRELAGPGIEVRVDHRFLDKQELIHWCAENTINVFFYNRRQPGLSATTDQAITSGRPLLVSPCDTFRHIHRYITPFPGLSLRDAIATTAPAVARMQADWHPHQYRRQFEQLVTAPSQTPAKATTIAVAPRQDDDRTPVLFVSHQQKSCGIHEYGVALATALRDSTRYRVEYAECDTAAQYERAVAAVQPQVIFYNYHAVTMPWLRSSVIHEHDVPHIGTIHEVTKTEADHAHRVFFDRHVAPDPTLVTGNPLVVATGRLIPEFHHDIPAPEIPTIGSFGFGFADKGFERVVALTEREFDQAIIRIHMPVSAFSDPTGERAVACAERCRAAVTKPGIRLAVTHGFLERDDLLRFLAGNTINVFLYDEAKQEGVSSVLDYAFAVGRPVALNRCGMFRHVFDASPSIFVEDRSLREIIASGITPIQPFIERWSATAMVQTYEELFDAALKQAAGPGPAKRYAIAVFHNRGDVLAATPIARQLKADDPHCHVTCFTSGMGEPMLRGNPHIDEIVELKGDPLGLDPEIQRLQTTEPWAGFFTPASYMNKGAAKAVTGGARVSAYSDMQASAQIAWSEPYEFTLRLSDHEVAQARRYWSRLPAGPKILIESEFMSDQSPWTDDWAKDLFDAFRDLDPVFVFSGLSQPGLDAELLAKHAKIIDCREPMRLNAEMFNLCDAFIGVGSGISAISYSDWCRRDVPRIELCRSPYFSAAELPDPGQLWTCFSRSRFREALREVAIQMGASPDRNAFAPPAAGVCPSCGSLHRQPEKSGVPGIWTCQDCGLSVNANPRPASIPTPRPQAATSAALLDLSIASRAGDPRGMDFLAVGASADQWSGQAAALGMRSTAVPTAQLTSTGTLPRGSVDIAMLHNELHDVEDPVAVLRELGRALRPGGVVACTAPNFLSLSSMTMGSQWRWLADGSIRCLFTPDSLRQVLLLAGFTIVDCGTHAAGLRDDELLEILRRVKPDVSPANVAAMVDRFNQQGVGEEIVIIARRARVFEARTTGSTALRQEAAVASCAGAG